MKGCAYYFGLWLKKLSRTIPSLLTGLLVLAVTARVLTSGVTNDTAMVRVGICGDTDSIYVDLATSMLAETETVELVHYDSEEEALKALKSRDIQGFASVPDGFINEALKGKNIALNYTVLKNPSSLSQTLTKEVIGVLSPVVFNSQNAVFGMRQFLKDSGNKAMLGSESDKMSAKYILTLLQRDRIFDNTPVGVSDGVDDAGYYMSAIPILFMLLCGAVMSPAMIKRNTSLCALLRFRGMGTLKQIMCEWGAFALLIYLFIILLSALMGLGATYGIKLIPVVLLLTAMQFFISELSDSVVSGLLLQFFIAVMLSYISGLFYPSYLLPSAMRQIARLLPVGVGFSYGKLTLSGNSVLELLPVMAVFFLLLMTASVVTRWIRMRGESI